MFCAASSVSMAPALPALAVLSALTKLKMLVNAWVFRRSGRGRLAAAVSLGAWAGVVVCGRLLAYV